jgi:hypothetical protein
MDPIYNATTHLLFNATAAQEFLIANRQLRKQPIKLSGPRESIDREKAFTSQLQHRSEAMARDAIKIVIRHAEFRPSQAE